ncbi:hypothetical protein ACO2Q1_05770 [Brevundimonas sp. VNH65]|uniref:hypothetical protein n=1 Tax=Brevundimonas sp. VNH65 TaxID=3400917 RepID=UPI003C0259BE
MAPTTDTQRPAYIRLTPEELAARKRRNVWIALGLVAFMVLLFTTTFLRMQHNQKAARQALTPAPAAAPVQPGEARP